MPELLAEVIRERSREISVQGPNTLQMLGDRSSLARRLHALLAGNPTSVTIGLTAKGFVRIEADGAAAVEVPAFDAR